MRTLPLLVEPVDDEILFSFLARLAAHNGGSLASVLSAVGLCSTLSGAEVSMDAQIVLPQAGVDDLAISTDLSTAAVRQLLLSGLAEIVDDVPPPHTPLERRWWFRHHHLISVGSRACTACLAQDGAFRRWWRLMWAFACPTHGQLLEGTCCACGRPHDQQRDGRPTLTSMVPQPGRCANPLAAGVGHGPNSGPCGWSFAETDPITVTRDAVAAQQTILGVVRADHGHIAGVSMGADAWLLELAGVVRALYRYGPNSNGDTDDVLRIDATETPPLLATLVPVALDIISQPSLDAVADKLHPLVEVAMRDGIQGASQIKTVGLRGRTLHAWSLAIGGTGRFSSRLRSKHLPPNRDPEIPGRLPQLLWPDVVDQFFPDVLNWVLPTNKRRFLSLALGVAATKATFADVANQLGLRRDTWDAQFYKEFSNGMRRRDEDDVAYRGVLACHDWLSSKTWTVDYHARRAAFPRPSTFTDDEWAWACWSSGVNAGAARRRQQAETWLWLALTGNSPRELTAGETDEPIGQQALAASVTARLAPALVVLGARHLLQCGLEGTARADLSGWDPTPPEPPSDLAAPAPPRRHHQPERTPTVRTGLAPLGNDPDIDRLIGLFGIDEVAAMLGLERKAVDRIRCGTRTPKGPRRRRVAYLLDLVDTLAYDRDDFHVRAWLTDKTPGEAPRDLLTTGSWEPSDRSVRDLLRRAQQETPGGEALRRRLVIVTEQAERTLRRPHPRVVPTDVFVVVSGLGADLAGRLVNALPVVVQRYRCGNAYPSRQVLARFTHIATIIGALAPRPNDAIVAWFATPSPDLSGRSPADILANPWEPSDLLAALVLEVARSDDNISRSQLCQTT